MGGIATLLKAPALLALVVCLAGLAGCGGAAAGVSDEAAQTPAMPEPSATPVPLPTAVPMPALDPAAIWVGVEGTGDAVVAVTAGGLARTVRLPLNEGQHASFVTAARDGRTLAYLVLNADATPRGVAVWALTEPNARLVAQPLPGYRIIALYLSDDSSGLAVVQVSTEGRLEDADWRIDRVLVQGGDPLVVLDREMLGDVPPLVPFAWPAGGPLLLIPALPGTQAGIYAANPQAGGGRALITPEEPLLGVPALSPDGSRLAYLVAEGEATAVSVHDLRLDQTSMIAAPEGQTIYGVRWLPEGDYLLVDVVAPAQGDSAQREQLWALVAADEPEAWTPSPPGPGRENLFDYAPFGAGVAYTVLPTDEVWALTILPDLAGEQEPLVVTLDALAGSAGAPRIIRTP